VLNNDIEDEEGLEKDVVGIENEELDELNMFPTFGVAIDVEVDGLGVKVEVVNED
jgi:hypothetical protein